jgi:hypothetical protein
MPPPWFLPALAAVSLVVFALRVVFSTGAPTRRAWLGPAALSAAFALFSVHAMLTEGPFGFWDEHVRHAWGNQIWFDLLLAVGIGWSTMAPRAKALRMHLLPWLLLVLCTGCIGLLAMLSRMLFLEQHAQHRLPRGSVAAAAARP